MALKSKGVDMSLKHTPGPWRLHDKIPTLVVTGELEIAMTECLSERADYARALSLRAYNKATREANARLIAAAPELADACQLTMDYFADPGDLLSPLRIKKTAELITKVHAALIKAGVEK